MDPKTQHLLKAPPLPLLLRMAAPSTIAFLVQGSVSLAEVWFIGQLGSVSLAAIALAFPFLMLTQTMSGGAMGGAVASAIARAVGAGDLARAEQLLWHALALGIAGALLLLALFSLGGAAFLRLLGGDGDVLAQAYAYTFLLLSGGVLIWSTGITTAIFRGMGSMQLPAAAMMLGALIQIPLSGCLILGAFGLPKLGITGAAVSALVSGAVVSGVLLFQLRTGSSLVKLRLSALVFSKANFEDILKVALPASLSPLLTVSTVLILTALVGTFGDAALAGYGIGSRVEFLIIPLVFGFGAAMTSLVGMSIGAGDIARAERIAWIGGACASGIAGLVGVVLALFPEVWVTAFTDDAEIIASATHYIQIVGPFFFFQGLGMSLYFASQGASFMLWPVAATILRVLLAGFGAVFLAHTMGLGLQGIYYAAALAMTAYALVIAAAIRLGAWRR
jgi:putative MATE family efflux protein